jgi:hypothetical protein
MFSVGNMFFLAITNFYPLLASFTSTLKKKKHIVLIPNILQIHNTIAISCKNIHKS